VLVLARGRWWSPCSTRLTCEHVRPGGDEWAGSSLRLMHGSLLLAGFECVSLVDSVFFLLLIINKRFISN
jgi:hypothetical protein